MQQLPTDFRFICIMSSVGEADRYHDPPNYHWEGPINPPFPGVWVGESYRRGDQVVCQWNLIAEIVDANVGRFRTLEMHGQRTIKLDESEVAL